MIKIAVVCKSIWPMVQGGAERVTYEVVKALEKNGYSIKLFVKYKRTQNFHPNLGREVDLRWDKEIATKIKKYDPDIVYVARYWGEAIPVYLPDNIPVINMHHSTEIEKYNIPPHKKAQLLLLTKQVLQRSNSYHIFPSLFALRKHEDLVESTLKYWYILPRGIDKFDWKCRIRKKKIINKNEIRIGYFGRIAEKKGILFLLKVLSSIQKDINKLTLVIYGSLMSNFKGRFEEYIKKFNPNLKIYSNYPHKEILKKIQTLDIVVFPSLYGESFGISVLEGLYYNGVVLASDIFEEIGIVSKEFSFIFKRNDKHSFVREFYKILNLQPKKLNEIAYKAHLFSSKYSWKKFRMNFINILHTIEKEVL